MVEQRNTRDDYLTIHCNRIDDVLWHEWYYLSVSYILRRRLRFSTAGENGSEEHTVFYSFPIA